MVLVHTRPAFPFFKKNWGNVDGKHSFSAFLLWLNDQLKQPVDLYREDGLQLLSVDLPIAVLIKQFEIPLELLVDFSLQHQADGSDVFHKVDVAVLQTGKETITRLLGWFLLV